MNHSVFLSRPKNPELFYQAILFAVFVLQMAQVNGWYFRRQNKEY
jgi:hypothetical protein